MGRDLPRQASIFFAIVYLVTLPWMPYPASFVVKGLPVALLAVVVFHMTRELRWLGCALLISALGDVLLDLDPQRLFVFGLASFLLAHLLYTFLFVRNRRRSAPLKPAQIAGATVVLIYSVSIATWLMPSLGSLQIPVAIYMCAITAMVVSAILGRFSHAGVTWGAVLFLISDSVLAVNKFKTPVPLRDVLVWSTYYLGQYLIAVGFSKEFRLKRNEGPISPAFRAAPSP